MATESPFLLFKVECPLCKTLNEFELIRVGAYTEEGRDTDFCPLNIKWRFPRYQGHHPMLYFTAMCAHCLYTREFNNSFKDWKSDNQFRSYRLRQVKERHLEQLAISDSVLKQMGEHVDINRWPNESAILKLLLAIYDEKLVDRPGELDLGRFYLRVAWLFRELDKGENPHLLYLRGIMHEMNSRFNTVKEAGESLIAGTTQFSQNVESQFQSDKQLPAELKSQMLAFQDQFSEVMDEVNESVTSVTRNLGTLATLMGKYRETLLGTESSDGVVSFGDHASFMSFLTSLQSQWDGIVASEKEALEKAVRHYIKAFADGRDISPGNQQIQASYLIAELSRRIGDFDTAKEYFASTIKTGQEFVYRNRNDQSRTALARKILELAMEQGRFNLAEARAV